MAYLWLVGLVLTTYKSWNDPPSTSFSLESVTRVFFPSKIWRVGNNSFRYQLYSSIELADIEDDASFFKLVGIYFSNFKGSQRYTHSVHTIGLWTLYPPLSVKGIICFWNCCPLFRLVKLDFFSLVDTKKCEVFCEAEIFGKAPGSGMNRTWGFHLQCFTLPGTTVDGRNPKQPLGM